MMGEGSGFAPGDPPAGETFRDIAAGHVEVAEDAADLAGLIKAGDGRAVTTKHLKALTYFEASIRKHDVAFDRAECVIGFPNKRRPCPTPVRVVLGEGRSEFLSGHVHHFRQAGERVGLVVDIAAVAPIPEARNGFLDQVTVSRTNREAIEVARHRPDRDAQLEKLLYELVVALLEFRISDVGLRIVQTPTIHLTLGWPLSSI